jgi:hypothetical protein
MGSSRSLHTDHQNAERFGTLDSIGDPMRCRCASNCPFPAIYPTMLLAGTATHSHAIRHVN